MWTGSQMIGVGWILLLRIGDFNTGGRYDPSTDTWTATNPVNAPTGRGYNGAVWTGSEMIVSGGLWRRLFEHGRTILRAIWRDSDTDSNCNSDRNCNRDTDRNVNTDRNAENYSYAEISSDTGTSALGRNDLA